MESLEIVQLCLWLEQKPSTPKEGAAPFGACMMVQQVAQIDYELKDSCLKLISLLEVELVKEKKLYAKWSDVRQERNVFIMRTLSRSSCPHRSGLNRDGNMLVFPVA